MGSHCPLQGILPAQGLNPVLPRCRQTVYHLSHQGSPLSVSLPMLTANSGNVCFRLYCTWVPLLGSGPSDSAGTDQLELWGARQADLLRLVLIQPVLQLFRWLPSRGLDPLLNHLRASEAEIERCSILFPSFAPQSMRPFKTLKSVPVCIFIFSSCIS